MFQFNKELKTKGFSLKSALKVCSLSLYIFYSFTFNRYWDLLTSDFKLLNYFLKLHKKENGNSKYTLFGFTINV